MWLLWAVLPALAGGYEVAQLGAIAGGTGHAGVAREADPALAGRNPAALADGGGLRLGLGAAVAQARIDARGPPDDPWATRTETPVGTPPHLYASYAGGPWVGGLAVNTAFAGGVRWPADSPLRFESIASEPRFFRFAPFVGRRIGPVALAAGVHLDTGSVFVSRATDHIVSEGSARILLRGSGVGVHASMFVEASPHVGLGLAYSGRSRISMAGQADFDVPDVLAASVPDQPVTTTWVLPDRLILGVRGEVGTGRLLADLAWTGWSVNESLMLDFAEQQTDDLVQRNDWSDSWALRGGGEIDLQRLTLRGGGYVDGLGGPPGPDDTLSPTSPDGVRVAGTLGAGVKVSDALRFDAFGELLRILERTSTSIDAPAATYRGGAVVGGLTASASF